MKTIEIQTSQNVTIQYELAGLRDRFIAFLIDSIIIFISIMILSIMIQIVSDGTSGNYLYFILIIPILFFYHLAFEIFNNGQSIGKKLVSIKVVKLNGKQPSTEDYVMRWLLRLVDITSTMGAMAAILISSTERRQRLGDILAGTSVVRLKPGYNIGLNDILKIQSLDNYTPTYPDVVKFTDEDMITVKTALDRYSKYPNHAHKKAILNLVKKVADQLELSRLPSNQIQFLKTIINDYIVLTR